MTPKEKAKELVELFEDKLNPDSQTYKCTECVECALICVDEILDVCKRQLLNNIEKPFWLEVKEEINKL